MGLIKTPSARPFGEAAVAGRERGRPTSNFNNDKAAQARVAATRWQSQNRSRNLGGNSEKPYTGMAAREDAYRNSSNRAAARRDTRFSDIEEAADDSRRFKSFRPRPPGTGEDPEAPDNPA